MNNQYRNFTMLIGCVIIFLAFIRLFGIFTPSILVMFCVSSAALIYSLIDLILELVKNTSKKIVIILDIIAIAFIALSFTEKGIVKLFSLENLTIPSEVVTLLAFGVVILTIGIKDRKEIDKTIETIKSEFHMDTMKKLSTLDSDEAKQCMTDLASYEYNTVFNINKVIIELKKCDNLVKQTNTIHDGWSILSDCFEYYRTFKEGPFYDHGLNSIFWEFDKHISSAAYSFSILSQPDNTREIADIEIFKVKFTITRFIVMRNHNISNEYDNAYKEINKALICWEELKSISLAKYELLGTIESHR